MTTMLLSTKSQDLITKLSKINPLCTKSLEQALTIDRTTLLDWFNNKQKMDVDEESFFLINSLNASLLRDLKKSLNSSKKTKKDNKESNSSNKVKFTLLAIAGTIYFGCEGFDGVTAIMGVFSSVPTIALFVVGTLFSILSMIVFHSFDLVEISKNLGVKSKDAPKLIDVLLDEFKQIKAIRASLSKVRSKSLEELTEDLNLVRMLLKRHEELNDARTKLNLALDSPYLKAGKIATAGVAGVLFFSGGFFAGQTVALVIGGLFVSTLAATAWPVVLAGIVVGLAAFSVYWFVERPGIENLITRWRGLDKDKIDNFCKPEVVERETEKLQNLINSLEERIQLYSAKKKSQGVVADLLEEVSRLNAQLEQIKAQGAMKPQEIQVDKKGDVGYENPRIDYAKFSIFGGLRRAKSTGDLRQDSYLSNAI